MSWSACLTAVSEASLSILLLLLMQVYIASHTSSPTSLFCFSSLYCSSVLHPRQVYSAPPTPTEPIMCCFCFSRSTSTIVFLLWWQRRETRQRKKIENTAMGRVLVEEQSTVAVCSEMDSEEWVGTVAVQRVAYSCWLIRSTTAAPGGLLPIPPPPPPPVRTPQ